MALDTSVKFWLVWSPRSGLPRVKQTSREKAESEAVRLSALNPGRHYYVCEVIGFVDWRGSPHRASSRSDRQGNESADAEATHVGEAQIGVVVDTKGHQ